MSDSEIKSVFVTKEAPKDGSDLVTDETYEQCMHQFLKIKHKLTGESGSAIICQEFEKMFHVLVKTKENEKRMIERCSQLNEEVITNHEKLEKTIEMCLFNKRTIEDLQKELEAARELVNNAQTNETEASQLTRNIKQQFGELSDLLNDDGSNLTDAKKKEDVGKQLQMKVLELEQATLKNDALRAQLMDFETAQEDENSKIKQLETALASEETDKQRELRKKEKLERDLRQAKDTIEELNYENTNLKSTTENFRVEITKLQQQLKEQKTQYEKFVKENNLQQEAFRRLQNEAGVQEANFARLSNDLQFKNNELKLKEEEVTFVRGELTKLKYVLNKSNQKLKTTEEQKAVLAKQFDTQKSEAGQVEKELTDCKLEMENLRKDLNEYFSSKDNKPHAQGGNAALDQRPKNKNANYDDCVFLKIKMDAMRTELKFYILENSKLRNNMRTCQRNNLEKLKCQEKLEHLTKKVKEQALSYNMSLADTERKSHDTKMQIKELNSKMEVIRVERNAIAKNALELKSEAYNMKQQATLVSHQVDQLREQTSYKDAALLKERHENQQLQKVVENYKDLTMKLKDQAKALENSLSLKGKENAKLLKEVHKTNLDRNTMDRAKKKIMAENNLISSQLIRRNDEMALLYEKIKLLEDNLNRGLIVYNRRLEDIRILKMEVRKLRCTKLYMMKGLETMEDKRREIFRIQQENLLVRTRCKVLEDELENPLNIHRWRKLKGSDPSQYEMILKMQWLQKRLIAKTELVIQKEKIITEKELLFAETKKTMARQAGPETLEDLSYHRTCLMKANDRIKALQAEVRMYKGMVDRGKERYAKDTSALKAKYLKLKNQKDGLEICLAPFTTRSRSVVNLDEDTGS